MLVSLYSGPLDSFWESLRALTTYLTVALVDKSWRSPGWKSCASFSPSLPQALRKTLRLSWTENKARIRAVHLQRQRIITEEFPGKDTRLKLITSKAHVTGEKEWTGGATQGQDTHKHTCKDSRGGEDGGGGSWKAVGVTEAKPCGLGRGGTKSKQEEWHHRFAQVPPNRPCRCKVTHSAAHSLPHSSFHNLKLYPPTPPQHLPAKPFTRDYLWNLQGGGVLWRQFVAMKQTCRWQKRTNISLKQLQRTWEWRDGFSSDTLSITSASVENKLKLLGLIQIVNMLIIK